MTGGGDGGEGGGGFVSINGDSMAGKLNALYGFAAGFNGIKILDVYQISKLTKIKRQASSLLMENCICLHVDCISIMRIY